MHVSQKFKHRLDAYRRPDGSRWTGQQLYEATGGVVTRSYFVYLRKGRIQSPGHEKMAAIAKAMGFPPAAWFEEDAGNEPASDWGLAGALRDETVRDTAREMARLSKRERRLVLGIVRQFGDREPGGLNWREPKERRRGAGRSARVQNPRHNSCKVYQGTIERGLSKPL